MNPIIWQRIEGLGVAAAGCVANTALGYSWWWPLALFLAFDLSMVGYFAEPRIGAVSYNAVHNYIAPAALGCVAVATGGVWAGILALSWAIHVGADRALGYGLKFSDRFDHTHLGTIGRGGQPPRP